MSISSGSTAGNRRWNRRWWDREYFRVLVVLQAEEMTEVLVEMSVFGDMSWAWCCPDSVDCPSIVVEGPNLEMDTVETFNEDDPDELPVSCLDFFSLFPIPDLFLPPLVLILPVLDLIETECLRLTFSWFPFNCPATDWLELLAAIWLDCCWSDTDWLVLEFWSLGFEQTVAEEVSKVASSKMTLFGQPDPPPLPRLPLPPPEPPPELPLWVEEELQLLWLLARAWTLDVVGAEWWTFDTLSSCETVCESWLVESVDDWAILVQNAPDELLLLNGCLSDCDSQVVLVICDPVTLEAFNWSDDFLPGENRFTSDPTGACLETDRWGNGFTLMTQLWSNDSRAQFVSSLTILWSFHSRKNGGMILLLFWYFPLLSFWYRFVFLLKDRKMDWTKKEGLQNTRASKRSLT